MRRVSEKADYIVCDGKRSYYSGGISKDFIAIGKGAGASTLAHEVFHKTIGALEAEAWAQFGRIQFENQENVLKMLRSLFPSFYKNAIIALKGMV